MLVMAPVGIARVGIIMGSDSDLSVMEGAASVLAELEVPYELTIVSAHRTPDRMFAYAREAEGRGIDVIIAGAGGAAHLPGMVASLTVLPVIGVPVSATRLAGQDSLLSIVQMPAGIPVATVAIDNATNAGLLAAQMLAIGDPGLRGRLHAHRERLRDKVLAKAESVNRKG
jgi:phosphoribosylaminoimidazole carboxylase PurE protein